MIEFVKGDIFQSGCQALVNPVNLQGVMGNGLALQFKKRFPTNFKLYKEACYSEEKINIGKCLTVREMLITNKVSNPVYIVNFPTKQEWRNPSDINYVRDGLLDLIDVIDVNNFKSIAIPPLGCGQGKLNWNVVKPLITLFMEQLPYVKILVYEPV